MRLNIPAEEEVLLWFDVNDIRSSRLYRIEEGDLFIIEQTSPPIEKVHFNRIVLLIYKNHGGKDGRAAGLWSQNPGNRYRGQDYAA